MTVADGRDDHVEDLSDIAAGRPLQLGDERDLVEIAALHPLGHAPDRLVDRNAELLVAHSSSQLFLRRLAGLLDHTRERCDETVPGSQGGRQHLEVGRELLRELVANLPQPVAHDHARDERNHQAEHDEDRRDGDEDDHGENRADRSKRDESGCRRPHVGDLESAVEPGERPVRPARYDGLSRLCASLGRGRRCFPHTCAREGGNALDDRRRSSGDRPADDVHGQTRDDERKQEERPAREQESIDRRVVERREARRLRARV